MSPYIMAGNWKMHQSLAGLEPYFTAFRKNLTPPLQTLASKVDLVFAVPYTLLAKAQELCAGTPIKIAAQNVHWAPSGAFTGEISIAMLQDLGISWTLVGHSERRQYFGENDDAVAKKAESCILAGLTPIVCVGETLQERQSERTTAVVARQVKAVLQAVEKPQNLVFAYEPVWAIGTGLAATSEQAQEVHAFIRELIRQHCGDSTAKACRILYGGSMKPSNTQDLLAQTDIQGGLVGGASLQAKDFAAMANLAWQAQS